ncbi:MAG: hypothetical protein HYU41_22505 [Candidatus Rokubacteria bacterium]|nr:hypothetical protein [Candidatus Rokubacteria bacterium]
MELLWPVLIVMTVGLILAVVLARGSRWIGGVRPYHRAFWCPFRGRNVDVDFVESAWDATPVEVSACSIFAPPTQVRCDKGCLGLGAFPPTR